MDRRRRWAGLLFVALGAGMLSGLASMRVSASSEGPAGAFWRQTGKVHPDLYALEAGNRRTVMDYGHLRAASGTRTESGSVSVAAVPTGRGPSLLDDLQKLGLEDGVAIETLVTGRLPIDSIDDAGELGSLQYMRPELMIRSTGAVTSQGDAAMNADDARTTHGVKGVNVKIGTISDSFDCKHGYAADKAAGELRDDVVVVKEGDCSVDTDEGRAMMQEIADVAPDAIQLFHTAGDDQLNFVRSIDALRTAGAKVIVDDVAFVNEPWFQDGVVAQAVDAASAAGVSYFSAAGNSGKLGYQSPYREGTFKPKSLPSVPAQDFDPGAATDTTQRVTIPANSGARIAMQWDDSFKTQIPTGPAPATDLDVYAFDPVGEVLPIIGLPGWDPSKLSAFPGATEQAKTLEPVEVMIVVNPEATAKPVDLVIPRFAGPKPNVLKWIEITGSKMTLDEFAAANVGTIVGHSQALGAMTVGAASGLQTASPPVVEPFSSIGNSQIFRDQAGNPIGPAVDRLEPNFVGPDNTNTSFFGTDTPEDSDSLPNFPGTSSAAPHVAGVAALALEKKPTATPADICSALSTKAIDMGASGPDVESGHGFINADAALAELVTPTVITLPDRCKPVTLSVDSVTKKEGNSGNAIFTFKVTKLGNAAQDVTVAFATADGTAKKDSDYKEKAGTLTFTPTDVSKTVDVEVAGDTVVEPDEMFDLTLADVTPVNTVRLTNTFGTATIDDDDDPASQGSPDSKLDFVTWGVPSESKASPGDKVKIDGTGFKADALLTGTLYSTPITLGTINATAAGAFAATVIIPDGATNGDHEIHIVGTDAGGGTRTIRYPITIVNAVSESAAGGSSGAGTGSSGTEVVGAVTSTSVLPTTAAAAAPVALPATGANITFLTELGSLLLMAGLVLVYGTRRRHSR